jgi:hypothetical protein
MTDKKDRRSYEDAFELDEENEEKSAVRAEPAPISRTTGRPLTYLSFFPLYNRLQQARVKSARKVIKEETGLAEDLHDHSRAVSRLRKVDRIIEKDDIEIEKEISQARAELKEAKLREAQIERELKYADEDDHLARLERQAKKAELLRKIDGEAGNGLEKLKKELKEKAARQKLYDEAEIKNMETKFRKECNKEATLINMKYMFAEVCDEIFNGKTADELDEREQEIFERLKDLFESLRDAD